MAKSRRKRKSPKRVLALPDLEQAKSAVLDTLTSKSGQRTYDHAITEFVEWYCSEPRLAFNRTVVLRYRMWSSTGRVAWPDNAIDSVARGTLGHCRFGWEGRPHSHGSDSAVGEEGG